MPTYEYVCDKCGHEFEIFQKMTDPPRKRCPLCRGAVRRRIGAGAGLLFKGSGFYATDYRSKEYRARTKSEKEGPGSEAKPKTSEGAPPGKKPDAKAAPPEKE